MKGHLPSYVKAGVGTVMDLYKFDHDSPASACVHLELSGHPEAARWVQGNKTRYVLAVQSEEFGIRRKTNEDEEV